MKRRIRSRIIPPPLNNPDITQFTTVALVLIIIVIPNYLEYPEGGMVTAARDELVRRDAVKLKDGQIVKWQLNDDVREELVYIWQRRKVPVTFKGVVRTSRVS
jgi:hypothetical protein